MGNATRLTLLLACCVAPTACLSLSGPDCIDETRGLSATARLVSVVPGATPSDTGRAHLSLAEARNHRTKATSYRDVSWFVGSTLVRARVTDVHVHEESTGRLLLTIPIDSMSAPPFVITQVFTRQPYTGAVPWNELYELVGNARTYVDVHTTDHPAGELRGVLRVEYPDWQTFKHAYCS